MYFIIITHNYNIVNHLGNSLANFILQSVIIFFVLGVNSKPIIFLFSIKFHHASDELPQNYDSYGN